MISLAYEQRRRQPCALSPPEADRVADARPGGTDLRRLADADAVLARGAAVAAGAARGVAGGLAGFAAARDHARTSDAPPLDQRRDRLAAAIALAALSYLQAQPSRPPSR